MKMCSCIDNDMIKKVNIKNDGVGGEKKVISDDKIFPMISLI